MYLKNDSQYQCGLRTRKEIITLNPGEVAFVVNKDIIELNSVLVEISEEEYNAIKFAKPTKEDKPTKENKVDKVDKEDKVDTIVEDKEVDKKEEVKEDKESTKTEEVKTEEVKEDKKVEPKKEAKEDKKEVKVETKSLRASKNKKQASLDELTATLEELKTKWMNTSRASKKEALQKQIKEVQDKIAKLK